MNEFVCGAGPCCSTHSHAADKKRKLPQTSWGTGGGGLPRTERQPAGLIARPAGQGRAVRPTHTPQIKRKLPQTSWGTGGGGLPRTERQPAGLIARPAGQGRAVRPAHTPQIKKELPQTSWESSFFMPVVGVEPTRVISTRDFESPSSAIPTHRRIVF